MPVERHPVSTIELCDSLGVDPQRFRGLERDRGERGTRKPDPSKWWILLDPEAVNDANNGHLPPIEQDQAEGKA